MHQYWRDDTFVEEVSTRVKHQLGQLATTAKNRIFDNSIIWTGINPNGRLLGHSYPITIYNDQQHIINALALSSHIIFMQVYYKNPDPAYLYRFYVEKSEATILTEDAVDGLNDVMVTLRKRLKTGYIVSKTKNQLQKVVKRNT